MAASRIFDVISISDMLLLSHLNAVQVSSSKASLNIVKLPQFMQYALVLVCSLSLR